MNEPAWIEHDGSAVCPVPAGHDVEVRFRGMSGGRDNCPEIWRWSRHNNATDITHYRDWTAWEQSKMTKADDVPRALAEQACTISLAGRCIRIECDKREEAEELLDWLCAHEPAPVDPLAEELRKAYAEAYRTLPTQNDPTFVAFVAACRARSVTLDPKGGEGA